MNLNKLGKTFGMSSVVEQAKLLKALAECLKNIGTESVALGKEIGTLSTLISEVVATPTSEQAGKIRSSIEKIQASKQTLTLEVEKAKDIIEQLKVLDGGDDKDAEKKGKIGRVIDATLSLLQNVTAVLEQLDTLIENVLSLADLLEQLPESQAEVKQLGDEILETLKDITDTLARIKEDVEEIKNIITGKEGKSKGGDGGDSNKTRSDGAGKTSKTEPKDQDEEESCWQRFTSCLCCRKRKSR